MKREHLPDDGSEMSRPKRLRTANCPRCDQKPSLCICDEPEPAYKATDNDLPIEFWEEPEL